MFLGQSIHPGGQEQVQLLQRELIQHAFQQLADLLPAQLQAVHGDTCHVISLGNVRPDGLGPVRGGLGGVEHHHKGLAQLLQLLNRPLLRLLIVLPGDVGDGAVCGHHHADGGVLGDDLPGPHLRRLGHGDLVIEPGGGHHPLQLPLHLPHRPGDHIAHAVDQPYPEGHAPLHRHAGGLLGDELGLRRHNGPAGAALGQLIPGPLPAVDIFDVGDDQRLHKALDEGGFSRSDRPHNADVDVALRPQGDILIDFSLLHCDSSFGLFGSSRYLLLLYEDKP